MNMPEALRLADELERYHGDYPTCTESAAELRRLSAVEARRNALLEALKEAAALAQQAEPKGGGNLPPPLQAEPVEPVSGVVLNDEGRAALVSYGTEDWHCALLNARRLYTAPPQRKPLTEEEVEQCFRAAGIAIKGHRWTDAVRNVERAHGIGEQP